MEINETSPRYIRTFSIIVNFINATNIKCYLQVDSNPSTVANFFLTVWMLRHKIADNFNPIVKIMMPLNYSFELVTRETNSFRLWQNVNQNLI